jgi:hypothetical protein
LFVGDAAKALPGLKAAIRRASPAEEWSGGIVLRIRRLEFRHGSARRPLVGAASIAPRPGNG